MIQPWTAELPALERLENGCPALERLENGCPALERLENVKCCEHSSTYIFDRIFFILGSNKDSHNISDEFEFQPDPTLDCRKINI